MDVFFLGGVCVGLAIYVLHLQYKLEGAEGMIINMIEAMMDIADGEAKAVRTGEGVRVVPATKEKQEKLLS